MKIEQIYWYQLTKMHTKSEVGSFGHSPGLIKSGTVINHLVVIR